MKYIYFAFLLLLLTSSCERKTDKKRLIFNIDFTIVLRNELNSFKIDSVGNATILVNKKYELSKVYKMKFSDHEIDFINNGLSKIPYKLCDSIKDDLIDDMRYVAIFSDNKKKIKLVSGQCKESKSIDNLIIRILDFSKRKEDYYESFHYVILKPDMSY